MLEEEQQIIDNLNINENSTYLTVNNYHLLDYTNMFCENPEFDKISLNSNSDLVKERIFQNSKTFRFTEQCEEKQSNKGK